VFVLFTNSLEIIIDVFDLTYGHQILVDTNNFFNATHIRFQSRKF